jgi:hypothetical protein
MRLETYISALLYRYECVIVPDFGGFVTNAIPSKINHYTHTFYPPSKQLSFNKHLTKNDGLLANYVASVQNISYTEAVQIIANEVKNWNITLKNDSLELEKIGTLIFNKEQKLIFEPAEAINYLTSSFGLDSYVSPAVKRLTQNKNVRNLSQSTAVSQAENDNGKTVPAFIKYAATAAILITLGVVSWNQYNKITYSNLVSQANEKQQKLEKTIQEATFVISNPLPAITLNVAKETHNFHIIAGAFREPLNAETKLNELLKKGYNAKILGLNKWGLTQVAYASFNSKNEAINALNAIKKSESKDAWLLTQVY